MALQFNQFQQLDFSGGITDYIYDAKANQCEKLDNLLLNTNKKPYLADGTELASLNRIPSYTASYGSVVTVPNLPSYSPTGIYYTTSFGQASSAGGSSFSAVDFCLISNESFLSYMYDSSIPNATISIYPITGPSPDLGAPYDYSYQSSFLFGYTPRTASCFSDWRGHVLTTNTSYCNPSKIISGGQYGGTTAYTVGLPKLKSNPNLRRTVGSGTGSNYTYAFLYYHTYTTYVNGASNTFEVFGGTTLVQILNIGAIGAETVVISGIPKLSNSGSSSFSTAGYGFCFDTANVKVKAYRTTAGGNAYYYIGQVNNSDALTALTTTITIASPGVFTVSSTSGLYVGMPVVFTTTGALPTGVTAGATYYVNEITSATQFKITSTHPTSPVGPSINTSGSQSGTHTVTFQYLFMTDTTTDAALLGTQVSNASPTIPVQLYTNGGVKDYDIPPRCKYLHTVNGKTYYANIGQVVDSGYGNAPTYGSNPAWEFHPNRFVESNSDQIDAAPAGNFTELPDEITGFSSYNGNPIAFTKNHAFRINGQYDSLGQGQTTFEDITKNVGCVFHQSIIQTNYGLFWASNDGFYWTDGFVFKKISNHLNETYKSIFKNSQPTYADTIIPDDVGTYVNLDETPIIGTYDRKNERIEWSVKLDSSSDHNDSIMVMDLKFGLTQDGVFSIRRFNGSCYPSCISYSSIKRKNTVIGDANGYIVSQNSALTTETVVDTALTSSNFTIRQVIPTFKSIALDFGVPNFRKWIPKMVVKFDNQSKSLMGINSYNESTDVPAVLKEIRSFKTFIWDDPYPQWLLTDFKWNDTTTIEEMRRFPATTIRASQKQVEISIDNQIIYNSDTYATANVNKTAKQVTFSPTYPGGLMPTDLVNYFIYFGDDNYTNGYEISLQSANVATILDPLLTLTDKTAVKWEIMGYAKYQKFNLISYIVHFAPISSQSYKTWRTEQDNTGANT